MTTKRRIQSRCKAGCHPIRRTEGKISLGIGCDTFKPILIGTQVQTKILSKVRKATKGLAVDKGTYLVHHVKADLFWICETSPQREPRFFLVILVQMLIL